MIDVPNRAYKFARAKLAREGSKGLIVALLANGVVLAGQA
jgi:hypothetical protein